MRPRISRSIIIELVRWQSGYAEDCKSLYVGSIPARTSKRARRITPSYRHAGAAPGALARRVRRLNGRGAASLGARTRAA